MSFLPPITFDRPNIEVISTEFKAIFPDIKVGLIHRIIHFLIETVFNMGRITLALLRLCCTTPFIFTFNRRVFDLIYIKLGHVEARTSINRRICNLFNPKQNLISTYGELRTKAQYTVCDHSKSGIISHLFRSILLTLSSLITLLELLLHAAKCGVYEMASLLQLYPENVASVHNYLHTLGMKRLYTRIVQNTYSTFTGSPLPEEL